MTTSKKLLVKPAEVKQVADPPTSAERYEEELVQACKLGIYTLANWTLERLPMYLEDWALLCTTAARYLPEAETIMSSRGGHHLYHEGKSIDFVASDHLIMSFYNRKIMPEGSIVCVHRDHDVTSPSQNDWMLCALCGQPLQKIYKGRGHILTLTACPTYLKHSTGRVVGETIDLA